jgi:hypothetical protein
MRFLRLAVIVLCVVLYGYSAVLPEKGQVHSVSVGLDKPLSIVWPCEVSVVGEMGEKGLRIGANIGRGWRGEAGGEASYKFYIPAEGKYHVWAFCLWFDECANAIFAKIDQMDKAIVGNDPVYKQWHWARGFDVELTRGTHTLVLSNHSDHIAVQKILFTNSAGVTPEGCSVVFSDIFYDGFDGCDRGNFTDWQIVGGQWSVSNPATQVCYIENALVGKSIDEAMIIYSKDDWSGYAVNLVTKMEGTEDSNGSAGVCFGVKDSGEYHQLSWRTAEGSATARMEISRQKGGSREILKTFDVPWESSRWHQVGVRLSERKIVAAVDDARPVEAAVNYTIRGGIGLRLEGKVQAYFDDIHVREATRQMQ